MTDLENPNSRFSQTNQFVTFCNGESERLFAEHMLVGKQCSAGDLKVQMVRDTHNHSFDVIDGQQFCGV